MRSFLKHNGVILSLYLTALFVAFFFIINYTKTDVHIYINRFVGNKIINNFFYYITYLGDGAVAPVLLLIIMIYNIRTGIYSTLSFLTASLSSQILKRVFFDDVNRPFFVFQWDNHTPITYVEGVDLYLHNSFPSGHSTQAFAIFMCLAFTTKNQSLKLTFFFIAFLTALSRVYLSQHWLTDITVGSIIGFIFSILFYYLIISKNKLQKFDKPLYNLKAI